VYKKTFSGIILLLLSCFFLFSCATGNKNISVGSDRDNHGCIGSAGYVWCEERHKCIREWEEPCTDTKIINVCYECTGLGTINVDYFGQQFATVETPTGKYKLERAISGSGSRYIGNNVMIWDKAGNALLEIEGNTYNCRVKERIK